MQISLKNSGLKHFGVSKMSPDSNKNRTSCNLYSDGVVTDKLCMKLSCISSGPVMYCEIFVHIL